MNTQSDAQPCPHADTISGQAWTGEDACSDIVTCLDCDQVIVESPLTTEQALLRQMEWLDD